MRTGLCQEGVAREDQHDTASYDDIALQTDFAAYGSVLEQFEVFKYVGRLLSYDNNDMMAVIINLKLKKAQKCCARISRGV